MPNASPEIVEISGLAVDGAGIGRLSDGRVTFIDGALPGDIVEATPNQTVKRVVHSTLSQIISPSPKRLPNGCDILACGGCPLRAASLELQAEHKGRRLRDTMRRIGGIDVSDMLGPVVGVGSGWAYRHRIRLHARHLVDAPADGGPPTGLWQLGYHARGSRQVVPLATCPVIWPELERAGRRLASSVASLPREAALKTVEMVHSRRDGRSAARLVTEGPLAAVRASMQWVEASELVGVEIVAADGKLRWGNLTLRYDHHHADAFDLRFEPGLFTQAFCEANDLLVAYVINQVAPKARQRVVELHAGIGNFTLPVARAGAEVTAVELHVRAAQMLERNAKAAATPVTVRAESDVQALDALEGDTDVLLMDPSRSGAREVMQHLIAHPRIRPRRIIYVSCDPGTLARDAGMAREAGYVLQAMTGFDMFPQTPHIEAVATFSLDSVPKTSP